MAVPAFGTAEYWRAVSDGTITWDDAAQATVEVQAAQTQQLAPPRVLRGSAGRRAPTASAEEVQSSSYGRRRRPQSLGAPLTRSARDLLTVISNLADQARYSATKVELAARIGVHPDTVRRGLRLLEAEGLILTYHRPGPRPDVDRPNVYAITPAGWATLNRRPPPALQITIESEQLPDSHSTAKFRHPSESKNNYVTGIRSAAGRAANRSPAAHVPTTSPLTQRLTTEGMASTNETRPDCKKSFRQDGGAVFEEARDPKTSDAPPTGPSAAGEGGAGLDNSDLAWQAVRALVPAGGARIRHADSWLVLDRARSIRLSKFNTHAWERAIAAHGRETALLAAAVAMLRPKSASGRPIRSRAGYLGSMLQARDLDAASSLRSILSRSQ